MVVDTPSVTFANAVTQVGMRQANLTAQLLCLGGATAVGYDRISVNTTALPLNNAGARIKATVNKAAAGNDAAFAFNQVFGTGTDRLARQCRLQLEGHPVWFSHLKVFRIDSTSSEVKPP